MGARLFIQSIDGRRVEEELTYPFDQSRVLIGRSGAADVRLPHRTVSERHASLERGSDQFRLTDHGSTNGTRVGGEKLVPHRAKRLRDGDLIEIGVYVLSFHDEVFVTEPLTSERTAELARRLFRQQEQAISSTTQAPRLVVLNGPGTGQHVDLPPPPSRMLVGSGERCQLVLSDLEIAEEEVELERDLDGVMARALVPSHPLQIGEHTHAQHRLKDGDELRIGSTTLLFEEPAESALLSLSGEEDEPLRQRPMAASLPSAAAAAAEGALQAQTPATKAKPDNAATQSGKRQPADNESLATDLLVYGLAAVILALSVAGLFVLLQAE